MYVTIRDAYKAANRRVHSSLSPGSIFGVSFNACVKKFFAIVVSPDFK